jgi:hypothetical protein
MKESPNPLAGIVDAMKEHDKRLAQKPAVAKIADVRPAGPPSPITVQTVASIIKPQTVGAKIYCGARLTRGQIEKMDQIILLTHKVRGVRLTQSDVVKQAIERLPIAALEEGEVAEILAANGRKQFNR